MEVGVRLIGIFLRLMSVVLAPLYWLSGRQHQRLPFNDDPILRYSAGELAKKIRAGELSSEQVVTLYIERIKAVNPYINAVVEERYQAALAEAKAVDRRLREPGFDASAKPLWGVPFTVKESCLLEGLSNSVGCLENAGRKATKDGEAVRLVRAAGAIPLLVSNTPELCLGWETTNLLNGTTNNPYCLYRTPGGSSGGEGALLASGASPFGVASDIAGSIRLPAAFCGVFGHKPTPGVISITGHIPSLNDPQFSRYLTVGPMARHATDLTLLMRVMCDTRHKEALRLDDPVTMEGLQVYSMTEAAKSVALLDVEPSIKKMIANAAKYLADCGANICDKKFPGLEDSVEISISEFFSMKDIPNMLQDPANPKRDKNMLIELLKFAFGGGSRSLQGLGFSLIDKTKLFIPESRREHYRTKAEELRQEMQRTLGTNGVLLYPVFSSGAHRHNEVFVRASGVMYSMVFNILGLPATAVPCGLYRGLPLSIQVIAGPYQDRLCLAVAEKLEEGFGGWRPPP